MSDVEKNKQPLVPKLRFKGFTDAWVKRKLGEAITVGSGRDYKHLKVGDIPVYGTGGYMLSVNESLSLKDGIGIGRKGTIDQPFILKAPYWTVDTLFYCVPKKNFLLEFMFPIFQQTKWKQLDESTGVPSLSKKVIENVQVKTPAIPEQSRIGEFFRTLDALIAAQKRKTDLLKRLKRAYLQQLFPTPGHTTPCLRFPGFTEEWQLRKLGNLFARVNERNNGQFGRDRWISVANMYFQEPDKVLSNNIDTRTYVMRKGDIAFEGHPNSKFLFGRFVANDIGDGVVSELFPIYRPKDQYETSYWKIAIQIESLMAPIFRRSITSSGNSSNKLDERHFERQSIPVPSLSEQSRIGNFFRTLDVLITVQTQKLTHLEHLKRAYLQKMFV